MALPLAPIAGFALRYGTVAVAAYAIARKSGSARRDQRAEDAMDETHEGLHMRRDDQQLNASGRMKRVVRFGSSGPAVEIDATALTRIRIRRI
jgi:hypothetical protein